MGFQRTGRLEQEKPINMGSTPNGLECAGNKTKDSRSAGVFVRWSPFRALFHSCKHRCICNKKFEGPKERRVCSRWDGPVKRLALSSHFPHFWRGRRHNSANSPTQAAVRWSSLSSFSLLFLFSRGNRARKKKGSGSTAPLSRQSITRITMAGEDAINAFGAAICASVALGLLSAASASCNFVSVDALDPEGGAVTQQLSFGVFCQPSDDNDLLHLEGDMMVLLCRVFLSLALFLGTVGTSLAWGITLCMIPTRAWWLLISVTSSLSAVLCVPVFLLFQAEPCAEAFKACEFSIAAYLLAFSLLFWVSVTIITQCLDPPFGRASSLSEWRTQRTKRASPLPSESGSYFSCIRKWLPRTKNDDDNHRVYVKVDRTMMDDSDEEEQRAQKAKTETITNKQRRQTKESEQEVAIGDSASQTLIVGDTASQTHVVLRRDDSSEEKSSLGQIHTTESFAYSLDTTSDSWSSSDSREPAASSLASSNEDKLIYTQAFVGSAPPAPAANPQPEVAREPQTEAKDSGAIPIVSVLGRSMTLESVQEEDEELESAASESGRPEDPYAIFPPPPPPERPPPPPPPPAGLHITRSEERSQPESIRVLGTVELPALADDDNIRVLGSVELPALADYDNDVVDEEEEEEKEETVDVEEESNDMEGQDLDVSEDLGSLEPTIDLTLTGHESLLDRDNSTQEGRPKPQSSKPRASSGTGSTISLSETLNKVLYAPVQTVQMIKGNRKRYERHMKNYKLLDDNDIEKSFPISSPPLEILTIKLSKESDIGLNPIEPPSKREQELFDKWIMDNRASRIAGSFSPAEPEPDLNFSTDDDDDDDDSGSDMNDQVDVKSGSPSRRKRRRRKARRKKNNASSASGGSSLISMPIAEETNEDLHDSDAGNDEDFDPYSSTAPKPLVRIRSAPNLAAFADGHDDSNKIFDDIRMTGINSYCSAEIFRGVGSSRSSPRYQQGTMEVPPDTGSQPDAIVTKRVQAKHKQKPLFRQERALKSAIHRSPGYVSSSSEGENSSQSSRSNKIASRARNARIRRLQGLKKSPHVSDDETPPKPSNMLERMKARYQVKTDTSSTSTNEDDKSDSQVAQERPSKSTPTTPSRSVNSNRSVSSYESGGSFVIDMLDVQLAELNRPDGSLKGPDEESL